MTRVSGLAASITAAALLAVMSSVASAEMISQKTIRYFQIGGRTAEDLDRELERNGPYTKSTGSRHPGATEIKFGGELTYVERNGRCSIGSIKVTLSTRIILPSWKNRRKADRELGLIWDTLSRDIKRHEERHAEIARQHAKKLESVLKRLRPQRNCDILQDKVAEATAKSIEAHDSDQIRFDRVESANFENRMLRLLQYRLSRQSR
ncbi:DUF922 domain-containing protein [Agrobacterium sp. a22-2]|uniref:DUF922 domain-containing Zn-dependent protease n=1 Tax=Agrobacterium sp. a22-2 TaxID=2283840 RepID=UPI001444E748|nr:DUF922 domain-containing protein [Agrobacterium sp. a22-2]NKN36574.1 DUF922 domain-containing protein [Agrobacterium sp. a22-2]